MNMIETTLTVSARKGDEQKLRWGFQRSTPYPGITTDNCGGVKWRNGEGLFREYGREAYGIGQSFACYLLKAGSDPVPDDCNRTHFAGYDGNPGTLVFRGRDLGEICVSFYNGLQYPDIRLNVTERAGKSEREFIVANIVPKLADFIRANDAALLSIARARLEKRFRDEITKCQKSLYQLEAEAAAAMRLV